MSTALASVGAAEPPPVNRTMITVSIMLATVMTTLDTTIANVALPHMAGSVSASADQITWVLTSYIVAAAIMTPMTGFLAARFGRKRVFVTAIVGFTIASALCGASQSLAEIVIFRILQGVFGASMMPLSQALMLDTYPAEERGPAMAVWGMGAMVAPIIGPVLGGWLTDDFSWRWVFYINLPVGIMCLLGVLTFLPPEGEKQKPHFDIMGFGLLSIMLAAFQLFLDRGQTNDWFSSTETIFEAATASLTFILFIIHTATTEHPFLPVGLLKDRNFITALVIGLSVGLLVFSVLALLPPMLESLLNYPVITTGLVTAPRGVGSLISMFVIGRIVGRVDMRLLILIGLTMFAGSFYGMSQFSLQMNGNLVIVTGFIQGLGTGLVLMPMTMMAFSTLDPALRADGAGVLTLVRNLGNSAGISIMQTVFTRQTQVVHSRLVQPLTPDNPITGALTAPFSLTSRLGVAALNGEVTRQSAMVAYIDVFHLMFLATLAVLPVVFLMRKPEGAQEIPEDALVE